MTSCAPNDLIAQASCLTCIPTGMLPAVITSLLCQLANNPIFSNYLTDENGNIITDENGNPIPAA